MKGVGLQHCSWLVARKQLFGVANIRFFINCVKFLSICLMSSIKTKRVAKIESFFTASRCVVDLH